MTETGQIIVGIFFLVLVYIFTRRVHGWRMKRALDFILKDLEKKGAVDHASAVRLPYATSMFFRMGTRDYRPKALEYLVSSNMVGMTGDSRYYLKEKGSQMAEAG
ncbi:MAG: hypothetical protein JRI80_06700 [Deltaproteobacteria bacterium]|nr:hypothetical protein [Deltaproteobacteria bacterium]